VSEEVKGDEQTAGEKAANDKARKKEESHISFVPAGATTGVGLSASSRRIGGSRTKCADSASCLVKRTYGESGFIIRDVIKSGAEV